MLRQLQTQEFYRRLQSALGIEIGPSIFLPNEIFPSSSWEGWQNNASETAAAWTKGETALRSEELAVSEDHQKLRDAVQETDMTFRFRPRCYYKHPDQHTPQ